ncbi:MAG TPA: 50S ribosomal protein L10 [Planctomycetaceae bacterium]|nr:50S ribosomal protein L10 [Planctomycetaceae bacterium]
MSKKVKEMIMQAIRSDLGEAQDLLLVDVSKMDGNVTNEWRLALRKANISALSVKNTLARSVLADRGVEVERFADLLCGPTTLVWGSEDIVELSRSITKWAEKIETLQVKGASVEGQALNADGVKALSKSPGRRELISEIVGLALSPGRQVAGALLGPARKLAGQVKTLADKE